MDYLEDFIYIQKSAIKSTFKSTRYISVIFIAIFAGALAINIANNILNLILGLGTLLMIKGIILYILEIFIASFIMTISHDSIVKNSQFNYLSNHEKSQFMYKIIQVGFIFYIADIVLAMTGMRYVTLYISPLLILIFNALPETIYLENYDGLNSILYSVEFLKKNFINWIFPNLIIYLIFKILDIQYILSFNNLLSKDPRKLIISAIYVIVYSVYIIYRGNMYEVLKDSSKRKREYLRNFE